MTNKRWPRGSAKNVLLFVKCILLRWLGCNPLASIKTFLSRTKFNQQRSTGPSHNRQPPAWKSSRTLALNSLTKIKVKMTSLDVNYAEAPLYDRPTWHWSSNNDIKITHQYRYKIKAAWAAFIIKGSLFNESLEWTRAPWGSHHWVWGHHFY